MNKKIIIGLVVGLLVLAGGVFAYMYQSKEVSYSEKMTAEMKDAKSLKDLLAIKDSQQCTFSHKNDNTETSGKVYLSNGKMKGEFITKYNNQEKTSYILIKDETLYAWENDSEIGISLSLKEYWEAEASENVQTPIKSDEKVDYDCSDWADKNESFEVPNEIQFTSMQEMMGEMMGEMMENQEKIIEDSTVDCSVCDQIPAGSTKDQCRAALGC